MIKPILLSVFIVIIVSGCAPQPQHLTFEQGISKINEIDTRYGASLKTPPGTTAEIDKLIANLIGFKASNDLPQSINKFLSFKVKMLEAEKLHAEGWQWGDASTTDLGFGCRKGYARIMESARLRNSSAQKGNEAVNILISFIEEFPKEAKSLNLTQIDALSLKASFFQIGKKAQKDAGIIQNSCGDKNINETSEVKA